MMYSRMNARRGVGVLAALCLLLPLDLTGCGSDSPAGPDEGLTAPCCPDQPPLEQDPPATTKAPEIWRVRRLGNDELSRTFDALVHAVPASLTLLPAQGNDTESSSAPPSAFEVDLYRQIAEEAAQLGAQGLLADSACAGNPKCLSTALLTLVERAYRGPLSDSERKLYAGYLEQAQDPSQSVQQALSLLFQAPRFLYVLEGGIARKLDEQHRDLTSWELASRLSYFLWGEPPDDALRADAASGKLEDEAVLRSHAQRMLSDERAARSLGTVLRTWAAPDLDSIAKADSVYPEFGPPLRASMMDQFAKFAAMALADKSTLRDLLTTERMPVDAALAKLLGVSGPTDSSWAVVTLPTPRFGILTLPGMLSANARADDSSPVLRGLFVRQSLLCQNVPPPPPGIPALPPRTGSSPASARERLEAHTKDPVCAGCHTRMDPLGFPFEIYDGLGRMRADADQLRTDGTLDAVQKPAKFADLSGLVDALTEADEVPRCWTGQWMQRALGAEAARNNPALEPLSARAMDELSWADLIVEIIATPAFRQVDRPAGK